jgi:hypothetical protein
MIKNSGGNRVSRDQQLINVLYYPQKKDFDDKLMIVVKDPETGKKDFKIITDPEITYYLNKDEHWTEKPVSYIEPEKVEPRTTKFRYLLKDMAYQLGQEAVDFFNECRAAGKFYYAKRLHLNANVHGSDTDITDYTIGKFIDENPQPAAPKLSKGYFDIEVDIMHHDGFPDEHEAPCPVNIITYFHAETMECFTFVWLDDRNQSVLDFQGEVEDFIEEMKVAVKEEFGYDNVTFHVEFYEEEIEVLQAFYGTVNELKPDFAGAWNMKFDKLTNIHRIEKAGYDPADIICPPEMPYKKCYYNEDTRNQDFGDKGDTFEASSYTIWIDQMLTYASLRKSMGKKESYALNAIAEEELGKKKLEFEADESIKTLPWTNFRKFAKYNIIDVILLHALEEKVGDIEMMYSLGILTRTRVTKAMKKTVCLKNLFSKFCRDQGYIMSNNHNASYGAEKPPSEKFRGAFVADPELNIPIGMSINGTQSQYLFENVIDMDLSSLYPSIILALNIDVSTQYGKLYMYGEEENWDTGETNEEDIAYQYFDSLTSRDWIAIGDKWFDLPTPDEVSLELEKELEVA